MISLSKLNRLSFLKLYFQKKEAFTALLRIGMVGTQFAARLHLEN